MCQKCADGSDADHRPPELLYHRRLPQDVRQPASHGQETDAGADAGARLPQRARPHQPGRCQLHQVNSVL